MGNSDIDLWPWLFEQNSPESIITIFVLGKDGVGVEMENFKKLNAQTGGRNLRIKLVICHDRLVRIMEGVANDHDYQVYIQELAERHQAREAIGAVVSANTRLSDRGRNHAPRQET